MTTVFASENVVINPALLRYAAVETDSEGLHVRLNFADEAGELRLSGMEARSVLRWLRLNVASAESGDPPRHGRTPEGPREIPIDHGPPTRLRAVPEAASEGAASRGPRRQSCPCTS